METNIQINQALFGYDQGHGLLASSLELSLPVKRLIAVASDISGTAPKDGYDRTFTGLPVPDSNYYALFATWLAPEMPRPGCVWSHVIFIELADLAMIPRLGSLISVFNRPVLGADYENYTRKIDFIPDDICPGLSTNLDRSNAKILLNALYSRHETSIVIPECAALKYQDLIFEVWSQQWPRLRRSFRFSTGSFSDRGTTEDFDLQITPLKNKNRWQGHALISNESQNIETELVGGWLNAATDDLFVEDGPMRQFLRIYGSDFSCSRKAFQKIVTAYLFLNNRETTSLVDFLIDLFNDLDVDEGNLLKRDLLKHSFRRLELEDVCRIIDYLSSQDQKWKKRQTTIDFRGLPRQLPPRIKQLLALILSKEPLSETIWEAAGRWLAESLNQKGDIIWLWENHPNLLSTFIKVCPSIAQSDEIWKISEAGQSRALEALESLDTDSLNWLQIVNSMMNAGTQVGTSEICAKAGYSALEALDSLESEKVLNFVLNSHAWKTPLTRLAYDFLTSDHHRLSISSRLLVSMSMLSPVLAEKIISSMGEEIDSITTIAPDLFPSPLRVPAAFLLVASVLHHPSAVHSGSGFSLGTGFLSAHKALEGASEPPDAWRFLVRYLPEGLLWDEWDRCKRLRKGVRKWLKKNPDSIPSFERSGRCKTERVWLRSITNKKT